MEDSAILTPHRGVLLPSWGREKELHSLKVTPMTGCLRPHQLSEVDFSANCFVAIKNPLTAIQGGSQGMPRLKSHQKTNLHAFFYNLHTPFEGYPY